MKKWQEHLQAKTKRNKVLPVFFLCDTMEVRKLKRHSADGGVTSTTISVTKCFATTLSHMEASHCYVNFIIMQNQALDKVKLTRSLFEYEKSWQGEV